MYCQLSQIRRSSFASSREEDPFELVANASVRPFLLQHTYNAIFKLTPLLRLLAAIFTLATAKSTPSLEAIVSDFDFDQLMKEAIQSIGLWAQHSETADAILSIIKTIRQKIRLSVSRT
jgi:hypothetical protein